MRSTRNFAARGAKARNDVNIAKFPRRVKHAKSRRRRRRRRWRDPRPRARSRRSRGPAAVRPACSAWRRRRRRSERRARPRPLPPAPLLRTMRSSLRVSARGSSEMRSCAPARLRWTRERSSDVSLACVSRGRVCVCYARAQRAGANFFVCVGKCAKFCRHGAQTRETSRREPTREISESCRSILPTHALTQRRACGRAPRCAIAARRSTWDVAHRAHGEARGTEPR